MAQLPEPWARKEQPMRRKIPSSRWIAVAVAAGLRRASGSPQRVDAGGRRQSRQDHGRPQVPRHDGLRGPDVHQELQPLHRDRAAERLVRPGGVLRAPDRHGRRRPQARSVARPQLEVEQRQQDPHAEPRSNGVKWSDGKKLTSSDVVYSFLAGRQDKLMDRVGLTGAGNEIVSVKARGPYKVVDQAEGARLAVHRSHDEPRVRRAAARLVQGQQRRELQQHEAGGLGTVQQ